MKRIDFALRGEFITLDRLLKACGLAASGGEAKAIVAEGRVQVDGRDELRKTCKLRVGQVVSLSGVRITLGTDACAVAIDPPGSKAAAALPAFHYAFLVRELDATRTFYVDLIGCREGRGAPTWIDFDFFGHQLSAHLGDPSLNPANLGLVDGQRVPMPHFGAILGWAEFEALARRLEAAGVAFVLAPQVRFAGQPGEQATMFLLDPSGNALEFKSFRAAAQVFAV